METGTDAFILYCFVWACLRLWGTLGVVAFLLIDRHKRLLQMEPAELRFSFSSTLFPRERSVAYNTRNLLPQTSVARSACDSDPAKMNTSTTRRTRPPRFA
eukprot:991362-Rhodomonas_salina.1